MSKKRKQYTVEEKLAIVDEVKAGKSIYQMSSEKNISRKCIRQWRDDEKNLRGCSDKRNVRKIGCGRKAAYPEIEHRLFEWFQQKRSEKIAITYPTLRNKAKEIAHDLNIPDDQFKVSYKWVFLFCRRHKLGSRRITHHGQADNRSSTEIKAAAVDYLKLVQIKTAQYSAMEIFNMDETPCYFDMCREQTIHFRGSKNVDSVDTGYRKSRFTIVLGGALSGRKLKAFVIFKGLKKVPQLNLPRNVCVAVSPKGSMNSSLMETWVRSCFTNRGPYFARNKSLLLMDSYGSHNRDDVILMLKSLVNTEVLIIPPKTTSFLQPMDVCVNQPFKSKMKNHWGEWFDNGPKEYTPKGYRKRPSYQAVINMISNSLNELSEELIIKSFRCCGIAENGDKVPLEELNNRLKEVLDTGIVGSNDDNGGDDEYGMDSATDSENEEIVEKSGNSSDNSEIDSESDEIRIDI